MKKILTLILSAAFFIGCGNDTNNKTDKKTDSPSTTTTTTEDPEAKKGLDLVAKSDCFTCHKLNEVSTGPTYAAVAAKYRNIPGSMDSLANKIIKGGSGNWGSIPMTPHPTITKEDALTMVHYVMSIK